MVMRTANIFAVATCFTAVFVLQSCSVQEKGPLNVNGGQLEACAKEGMAMTGATQKPYKGYCTDFGHLGDSHHICIQMTSDLCTTIGETNLYDGSKFLTCSDANGNEKFVTCGKLAFRQCGCFGDRYSVCAMRNWCVNHGEFAGYLQTAGGCDSLDGLICDATDLAAVEAYEKSSNPDEKVALACIKQKCGTDQSSTRNSTQSLAKLHNPSEWTAFAQSSTKMSSLSQCIIALGLLGAAAGTIFLVIVARRQFQTSATCYVQLLS